MVKKIACFLKVALVDDPAICNLFIQHFHQFTSCHAQIQRIQVRRRWRFLSLSIHLDIVMLLTCNFVGAWMALAYDTAFHSASSSSL